MADITTEKTLALVNDPAPSNINLGCKPNLVCIDVKHDCVIHHIAMHPEEATRLGVALIQLSAQANAMGQFESAKKKANGIVTPGSQ